MGIEQVLSAPGSPWQRAYIERVIGTIRRECLDHVIVSNESGLYRHLQAFCSYYHRTRTHLALQKDTPETRGIQAPEAGGIISIPEVGGLHHRTSAGLPERDIGLGKQAFGGDSNSNLRGLCRRAAIAPKHERQRNVRDAALPHQRADKRSPA